MADPFVLALSVALLLTLGLLVLRARRAAQRLRPAILIDGSNVMHWQDATPRIAPIRAVLAQVTARGLAAGVIFDANAGYKLCGRFMNEGDLARHLGLRTDQVLVVPKGTQADAYLLAAARKYGARIVTRDRFRDWAANYPEVTTPGFLLRGGYRHDGAFWLEDGLPERGGGTAGLQS